MIVISSLLYLIPALLAIVPSSATPTTAADDQSLRNLHLARIEAKKALRLSPPVPALPYDEKAMIASRQYNPRKRQPKRRFFRRALVSSAPVPNTVTGNGIAMSKFYEGSGFIETDANPTTEGFSPSQTTFSSTLTNVQAVQSCADYSVTQDRLAFQLYFLGSQDIWVCRGYYNDGNPSDASYFNVPNDDVLVAYGYQV